MKNFEKFINEAEMQAPPAQAPPPAQTPPAQPGAQPPAQPPAQAQSGTTQGQAQPPTQPQGQGEAKSGDLSSYENKEVTKFPDTVKKMVDLLKDMDKSQLVKIRNLIAELKSINDAKEEIGKL